MHSSDTESSVTFKMTLGCSPSGYLTPSLDVVLAFYQNGILQVTIDQPE